MTRTQSYRGENCSTYCCTILENPKSKLKQNSYKCDVKPNITLSANVKFSLDQDFCIRVSPCRSMKVRYFYKLSKMVHMIANLCINLDLSYLVTLYITALRTTMDWQLSDIGKTITHNILPSSFSAYAVRIGRFSHFRIVSHFSHG